ncbi:hypothetical protein, partial [Serratia silvae]
KKCACCLIARQFGKAFVSIRFIQQSPDRCEYLLISDVFIDLIYNDSTLNIYIFHHFCIFYVMGGEVDLGRLLLLNPNWFIYSMASPILFKILLK